MNRAGTKLSKCMQKLGHTIDSLIKKISGERIGFTLIVYTEERASYISNVDRKDAIREINFLLECWEKEMPDIKAHDVN